MKRALQWCSSIALNKFSVFILLGIFSVISNRAYSQYTYTSEGFEQSAVWVTGATSYAASTGTWTTNRTAVKATTSNPHTGTYALAFSGNDYVITPTLTQGANVLTFYARSTSTSARTLTISISTDGGMTYTNFASASSAASSSSYILITITINNPSVTNVKIAYPSAGGGAIDDILITPATTCTTPTLSTVLQAAPVCSGNSATINLTGMVASSTNNTISYSIGGTAQTPITGVNVSSGGTASFAITLVSANNSQSLVITGITNSTCNATFNTSTPLAVTASPTASNAGPDQAICNTGTAMLAANTPTVGTGSWTSITGTGASLSQLSSTSSPTAVFTPPAGGTGVYSITWTTVSGSCNSSSTVNITVSAPPTASNAGTTQTICSAGTATLTANAPTVGTGAWTSITGPSTSLSQLSSTTNPTAVFTPANGAGTYILTWTTSNSPCASSSSTVSIVVTASPTTSIAGTPSPSTICNTGTSTLAANTPTVGTGAWTSITGTGASLSQLSSTANPAAVFTPPVGGTGAYVLTWTTTNGTCSSSSTATITVNAPPTTSNAGPTQNICIFGTATLAANTPTSGTGAWTSIAGPSTSLSQLSSTTSPTAVFTPAGGAGTYTLTWTITSSPCLPASTSTVNIVVGAGATITTQPSNAVSTPGAAINPTFTVATSVASPSYQWQYSADNGITWNSVITNVPANFTYSNANTATLTIATTSSAFAGTYYYRALISSALCPTPSNAATLTLNGSGRTCGGGNFTIDNTLPTAGNNFKTFTEAVNDLNTCLSRTAPITFNVHAGQLFTENVPAITIGPAASSANFVLFQVDPSTTGAKPIIQSGTTNGGTQDAIITIKGTNYIIFNGINLQENVLNTTIARESEYGYYLINTGTNGAQNNTIENCTISLNRANTNGEYGIYQNTLSTATTNSGNTYLTDTLTSVSNGIYLLGAATAPDLNCTISHCIIGSGTAGDIGTGSSTALGIGAANESGVIINNNEVRDVSNTSASISIYGIYSSGLQGTSQIYANKVHDITNGKNNSSSGAFAIVGDAVGTVEIYNNFVYNIFASSTNSSQLVRGIMGTGSGTIDIYFNSIYFSGSGANVGMDCVYLGAGLGNGDVQDNIFKMNYVTSTKSYCIDDEGGLTNSNVNIFDVTGVSPYEVGKSGGTQYPSLGAWFGGIGMDNSSESVTQFPTGVAFVSTTDLHLAVYIVDARYSGPSPTRAFTPGADIDGDVRAIPMIGADEVTFTTPAVTFATLPVVNDGNVAKSSFSNLLYGTSLTVSNASTTLSSITFATAATNTYTPGANDFLNFTLWYSTSATFSTSTATALTSSPGPSAPALGGSITFSGLSKVLPVGGPYYLYVTADVASGATATSSHNINITKLDTSTVSFAALTYKIINSSSPLADGGVQTICTFYYNTGYISQAPGITDLIQLNAWNDQVGGGGNPPPSFTASYQDFVVMDPSYTMSDTLRITGTNSRLTVGTGTSPITFTPTKQLADTVDVQNLGTLNFQLDPVPTVFDVLFSGSTVQYGGAVSQTVLIGNYYNLSLNGSGNRNLTTNVSVAKNFTPNAYTAFATNTATMTFNGTTVQTVPGFTYNGLTINNTSGTTTKTTGNTTVNAALNVTTAFDIPATQTLALGSSGSIPSTTGGLTIDGTLVNPVSGSSPITSTSSTLIFTSTGVYWLTAAPTGTATAAQIPLATWANYSLCKITGIVGPASNDYNGLAGIDQAFSNMYIDCPNMLGRLVLGFNANGSFQIKDTLTVNSTGTGVATDNATKVIQLTSLNGQTSINVGAYIQHGGSVYISDNTTSSNSRILTVAGIFKVDNANAAITGNSFFYLSDPNSGNIAGQLNVGGNFSMASGTTLDNNNRGSGGQSAGYITFTGTSGQTAGFGTVSSGTTGDINVTVQNAANTVTLLSNLNCGTLSLTGKLAINGNILTLNGRSSSYLQATGAFISNGTAGTLSGSSASKLVVGASATYPIALKFTYDASKNTNSLDSIAFANTLLDSIQNSLYIVGGTSTAPGTVNVGSGATFVTRDSLTLESNASGTARVAANISGATYITGNVTIERYIRSHRAWRLLTGPISSNQTINASWQEGASNTATSQATVAKSAGNPVPGYGTEVTCTIATPSGLSGTGFDQAVTNNPSILYMNTGHVWVVPSSTLGLTSTTGMVSNNSLGQQGYMLFVRGDRSVIVTPPIFNPSTITTLRTKGTLIQGSKSFTSTVTSFQVMGNPYASQTSLNNVFTSIDTTIVGSSYYAWDPMLTGSQGVGAFVTFNYNKITHNYDFSTPPASTFTPGQMESGEAIVFNFLKASTPLQMNETDKSTGTELIYRPAGDTTIQQSLRTELWSFTGDTTLDLDDGALDLFDSLYSDSVSWTEDSKKIGNSAEDLALERDGNLLSIEKRQPISVNDTIFYLLANMKQNTKYQLQFATENFQGSGLVALLQDNFMGTLTPLSYTDTTKVNFTVTSNPASQGGNRFRIIFELPDAGPLPVTFTSIKAWQQSKDINVQWDVTNELNIKDYVVEKSVDGKNFTGSAVVAAKGNNAGNTNYTWLDTNPADGDNYYRIESIGDNGAVVYTQIVKVKIGEGAPSIAVYPNPVKNGMVNVQFVNMPAGKYGIRIIDNIGQELYLSTIQHAGGSAAQSILFNRFIAKGIYNMEITNPDNTKSSFKLIVQ